jgi:spermidine synthase
VLALRIRCVLCKPAAREVLVLVDVGDGSTVMTVASHELDSTVIYGD